MSEIIVEMEDYIKIKGGHYKQDLVRFKDCKYFAPINNNDHGLCGDRSVYDDDFCSAGELKNEQKHRKQHNKFIKIIDDVMFPWRR